MWPYGLEFERELEKTFGALGNAPVFEAANPDARYTQNRVSRRFGKG